MIGERELRESLADVSRVGYVRVMNTRRSWTRSLRSVGPRFCVGALVGASIALLAGCQSGEKPVSVAAASSSAQAPVPPAQPTIAPAAAIAVRTTIGFRSQHYLDEHFAKHGREFPGMSKADYLLAAQTLRDSPVGGDVEQVLRSDGTASRFDKASGAFIAFNRDRTIRTFFKPNDGERYFRRQAQRSH